MIAIALAVFLTTTVFAEARFYDSEKGIENVIAIIKRRLDLMPEVAAWKWNHNLPITDVERERLVLERSVAQATELGLDPNAARTFFDVQIKMARDIQQHYFDVWRTQPNVQPTGRDLNAAIRPELDEIGKELLLAVYLASGDLSNTNFVAIADRQLSALQVQAIEHADIESLGSALRGLRRLQDATLKTIREAGVIRIGTTGDYAPFSLEHSGTLDGSDIELAENLAAHIGVQPVFVRTTWATLMEDLQQRRFDIAMSGISVTRERERSAEFSSVYFVDGKMPIARCSDRRRFATLSAIDRPNVRVVVNPGGTNERFAREHIHRAHIQLHNDNRTIFNELLDHRADVMITDGVEVALQTRIHRTLCATMTQPIVQSPKALMYAKGSELRTPIQAVLAEAEPSKAIAEWVNRHAKALQK